jgi:hypothetical protein
MLQAVAKRKPQADLSQPTARLLEIIKEKSLLKGQFKLASGAMSDYYLDMKPTTFDPEGSSLIADIVFHMIDGERDVDSIGGLELGAVPIICTVCARSWPDRPNSGLHCSQGKKGSRDRQKDRRQLPSQLHGYLVRRRHDEGWFGDASRPGGSCAGRDR